MRFLIILLVVFFSYLNPSKVLAERISYSCSFDFVLENRFPCSGDTIIDGDGMAHFSVNLSQSKSGVYKLKILQTQPAIIQTSDSSICIPSVKKTYRTSAALISDTSRKLKLKYYDSNLITLIKPLDKNVAAKFSWVFGYSGASSKATKVNGSCVKSN